MIYFISDTHFGNPFRASVEKLIIANINSIVQEEDVLYHLGDFCIQKSSEAPTAPKKAFDYYRKQIKCKNLIILAGNHDSKYRNGVDSIIQSTVIRYGGKRILLTHNPDFAKEHFPFNFTGHYHGQYGKFRKLNKKSVIVDLSVDCWNFKPVTINEIFSAYAKWLKNEQN